MNSTSDKSTIQTRKWVASVAVMLCLLLSFSGALDRWGEDYTAQGFQRALTTFAIARGLNGVISVAQETELVLQPVGVGITLAPGQILDPVNDLIERFSWVMLASTTSLGIQNLLLDMAGWRGFSILLLAIALVWGWCHWRSDASTNPWAGRLSRILVMMLVMRFAVPVAALASEAVFDVFLAPKYSASVEQLQEASGQVESLNQSLEVQPSLADRARQLVQSAGEGFSLKQKMQDYKDAASQATESAIELIVIFVFQSILLPLAFLWLLVRLFRDLGRWLRW